MAKKFKWLVPILILLLVLVPLLGSISCTPEQQLYYIVRSIICGIEIFEDGNYQGVTEKVVGWLECVFLGTTTEAVHTFDFKLPGSLVPGASSAMAASEVPDITVSYKGPVVDGGRYEVRLSRATELGQVATMQNDNQTFEGTVVLEVSSEPFVPVPNHPPVADAGPDQTVFAPLGSPVEVTLDGSGSYDPDGDPLTYTWTWDGHVAHGVSPTIELPILYTTITLVVNDGKVDSEPDTVDVFVGHAAFDAYFESLTPRSGDAPLTMTFINLSTGGALPYVSAVWVWDDGTAPGTTAVDFGDTITHTYTTPGSYVPSLTITDSSVPPCFSVEYKEPDYIVVGPGVPPDILAYYRGLDGDPTDVSDEDLLQAAYDWANHIIPGPEFSTWLTDTELLELAYEWAS